MVSFFVCVSAGRGEWALPCEWAFLNSVSRYACPPRRVIYVREAVWENPECVGIDSSISMLT